MAKALEGKIKLQCPKCESRQVYVLVDKTNICRKCGNRWKIRGEKNGISQSLPDEEK